jgi:hypothetical protein
MHDWSCVQAREDFSRRGRSGSGTTCRRRGPAAASTATPTGPPGSWRFKSLNPAARYSTVCQGFRIPNNLFYLYSVLRIRDVFTKGFHWKFTMRLLSSLVWLYYSVFRIRIGFSADPVRIWIQHFSSMRIRIQIWSFDDQNLEKLYSWNKIYIFSIKNCNYP